MGWVRKRATPAGRIRWRAGFRRPDGTIASQTFDLEREGWAWVNANEGAKATGAYADPRDRGELLEVWMPRAIAAQGLKPKPRLDYDSVSRVWIVPYLGDVGLRELTRRRVMEWLGTIRDAGATDWTITKAYRVLSAALSAAVDAELLPANPALGVKVRRPERAPITPVAEADVWRIAGAIDPRYRALVLVLAYGGLRIGEAVALRRHDVHLGGRLSVERNVVEVDGRMIEQATTKTGKARTVPLPASVADELTAHLERFAEPGPAALVFPALQGGYTRPKLFLARKLRPAAAALQLPVAGAIRTHHLRHTAVAIAIGNGWDVLSVQRMLGHSSSQVTLDVYGHLFETHATALLEQADAGAQAARAAAASAGVVLPLRKP